MVTEETAETNGLYEQNIDTDIVNNNHRDRPWLEVSLKAFQMKLQTNINDTHMEELMLY